MANEQVKVNFAGEVFELTYTENWYDLGSRIQARISEGGGWVDVNTRDGGVSIFVSPGVPVWLDRRGVN